MVFLRPVRNELRAHWLRLMVIGFLLLLTGELAVFCAILKSTAASSGVLGMLALSAGVLHLHAVICRTQWPGSWLQNVAATLYLIAGLWLIGGPSRPASTLTFVLAISLLGGGAYRVLAACACRHVQWGWAVLSGCVTVMLGSQMMWSWPAVESAMTGAILGMDLALSGITWLGLAWQGWRNYQQDYLLPVVRQPSRITGF